MTAFLPALPLDLRERLLRRLRTPELDQLWSRTPKPVGSFGYDPWGYRDDTARRTLAVVRWFYTHYFRVSTQGLEHIPAGGRLLVVGNHSGQLLDGLLVGTALALNPQAPRAARVMMERFLPTVPFLGNFLNALGAVLGDPHNCARLLEREEAIVVFPEGRAGASKPARLRYQLQPFGSGFMHLALAHEAPIVPVGIVGCEEAMPVLPKLAPLARLLGLPAMSLAPLLPMPARVHLQFGPPLRFSGPITSEDDVADRVETVMAEVRRLIALGLEERQRLCREAA